MKRNCTIVLMEFFWGVLFKYSWPQCAKSSCRPSRHPPLTDAVITHNTGWSPYDQWVNSVLQPKLFQLWDSRVFVKMLRQSCGYSLFSPGILGQLSMTAHPLLPKLCIWRRWENLDGPKCMPKYRSPTGQLGMGS